MGSLFLKRKTETSLNRLSGARGLATKPGVYTGRNAVLYSAVACGAVICHGQSSRIRILRFFPDFKKT